MLGIVKEDIREIKKNTSRKWKGNMSPDVYEEII